MKEDIVYSWHGETLTCGDETPKLAQAYLALLEDEAIQEQPWIGRNVRQKISRLQDNTGTKSIRFELEAKYNDKDTNEEVYCIQMQVNREGRSKSLSKRRTGTSFDSLCEVHIPKSVSPTPTVFRDACWSSAKHCNKPATEGNRNTKTYKVRITSNHEWKNEDDGESGKDEAVENAAEEQARADHQAKQSALEEKIESGEVSGMDFKAVYGDQKHLKKRGS